MKAKYWLFSSVVFLLLISFIYSWKSGLFSDQDVLYIAVSGPMTGTSEANGKAMVQGIQLYLDQINQQGGIHGHPVELLIFDDQNQPELAKKRALEIATQHKTLAVIGHYNSSASIAAAPIYREYGLPAISGSATADELTKGNDWYFRTIFNNSDQGALLANYVHKVLNYDDADIFFDDDIYGSTLAESFRHTAKWIGLEIKHQWHFNLNNKDKDRDSFKKSLKNMIATQQASPQRWGLYNFSLFH
jgi:branched-chain amino acid transport system substrate-binding protein